MPLWRLIDFADDVEPADRAALEAGLEAAGLLDAWVTPTGGLLDPGALDTAIVIGAAPATESVADVLRPGTEVSSVPVSVIEQILTRIGLGASSAHTWIDVTGRFQLGATRGAWHKREAMFIGSAARQAARLRRIAELDAERDQLERTWAGLERQSQALDDEARQVLAEFDAVPDAHSVREAVSRVAIAHSRLVDAERLVDRAEKTAATAGKAALVATTTRDEVAAELDVTPEETGQQDLRDAVTDLREALAGLWPRLAMYVRTQHIIEQAHRDVDAATPAAHLAGERSDAAAITWNQATAAHETLREVVGQSVDRVVQALEAAEREREQAESEAEELRTRAVRAAEKRAKAEGQVELLTADHQRDRDARQATVEQLRLLATTGLVEAVVDSDPLRMTVPEEGPIVVPDVAEPWVADRGVRLARDLRRALPQVDAGAQAWDRAGSMVHSSFGDLQRTLAAQGARVWQDVQHGVIVVGVHFSGQDFAVHPLVGVLDERLDSHRRLLDAREQQILEDHLITDVAAQLGQLIGDAERQVARMNAELQDRPNSTGMVLRLRWRPDPVEGPIGLA